MTDFTPWPIFGPEDQRLLVPAYFFPSGTRWQDTCAAILNRLAIAVLIMNPDSGPGQNVIPAYQAALTSCQDKMQSVIGYVTTDRTNRDLADVKQEVLRYYDFYPTIAGIFFDEMTNDAGDKDYYRELYSFVKERSPFAAVVGNPGIPAATAWQVTDPKVADVLVVFEGPWEKRSDLVDESGEAVKDVATPYKGWHPPAWVLSRPRRIFAHIVYESPSASAIQSICELSYKGNNAGWIYVTTDGRPNPFDEPPDAALIASPTLEWRSVLG
ncbi:spherulation-specific family 4 protein [Geodermatophilus sp. URMC 63]